MRRLRWISVARASKVSPRRTAAWNVMWASMPTAIGPCEFDASPNARIGEREDRAAVAAAVEVQMALVDRHRDFGVAQSAGADRDAEGAADAVLRGEVDEAARRVGCQVGIVDVARLVVGLVIERTSARSSSQARSSRPVGHVGCAGRFEEAASRKRRPVPAC